jgi:3-methyladenine DNA glycosylase AlkD
MDHEEILEQLKSLFNPDAMAGMRRYGINTENTYGVSIPALRKMAKEIGKNHRLAQRLWSSGIRDARILASMIDNPSDVGSEQMEGWVRDFDSWDLCDQCCSNLFDKTDQAYQKAAEWSGRHREFEKRAGFVLMACLAVHDKKAKDDALVRFLPIITREAGDKRNFVKKAVNWALRQIGKRSIPLNRKAIETAEEIRKMDAKSARWIAADALRELGGDTVQKRLSLKEARS